MDTTAKVLLDKVIVQILSRLSAKLVVKAKLVSKLWCRLISDDEQLVKLQCEFASRNPQVLFQFRLESMRLSMCNCLDGVLQQLSLDYLTEYLNIQSFTLKASCNGLLLLSCGSDRRTYLVCNPIIRVVQKLPSIKKSKFKSVTPFDHEFNPIVGFTYDLTTREFKVALFLCGIEKFRGRKGDENRIVFLCMIYDSSKQKWKGAGPVPVGVDGWRSMGRDSIFYVDGYFHFLVASGQPYVFSINYGCTHSRDLPLPPVEVQVSDRFYLEGYDGRLCLIRVSGETIRIWILDDVGRWFILDQVTLPNLEVGLVHDGLRDHFVTEKDFHLVSVSSGYYVLQTNNCFWFFDRKSEEWKRIFFSKTAPLNHSLLPAHLFWGTICSLKEDKN